MIADQSLKFTQSQFCSAIYNKCNTMLIYVLIYQNQPVVFFNVLHLKEYNLVPD